MRYLIIHHSVTGHNVSASTIQSWGYDKVIRWSGEVLNAKGNAHTYGHNYDSLGVCLIGNFEVEKPNPAQISSLIKLLKEWKQKYPNARIVGHRDLRNNPPGHNFTACPGKYLYAMLDEIKKKVETNNAMDKNQIIREYETDPKTLRFRDNVNKDIFIFRLADNQDLNAKTLDYYTINPDILVGEIKQAKKTITEFKIELREKSEEVSKLKKELKEISSQLNTCQKQVNILEKEKDSLQRQIDALKKPQQRENKNKWIMVKKVIEKAISWIQEVLKRLSY